MTSNLLPSAFIIQDVNEKEQYQLKFLESCKDDERKVITGICESIYGINLNENTLTIPLILMPVLKMYLGMSSISYLLFDEETINNHNPKETNIHAVSSTNKTNDLVVKVQKKSGIITTSKYNADVINIIKSFDKSHRLYNKDTFAWTITNPESLKSFIKQIKDQSISIVESY